MTETADSGVPPREEQASAALVLPPSPEPAGLTPAQQRLRQMVVDSVVARTSKLAYGHALDLLFRFAGGKFLLGHSSIQTTERYLGSEQEIAVAVNDAIGS